mgnify:CR=1 FL=1
MKKKTIKNILIIGASLYGCLLAYQLSKNKKLKVYLIDASRKILSSLDPVLINKVKINNGFHAVEIPRANPFVKFLREKLKIKLVILNKIQKLLIYRFIIDFKDGLDKWPKKLRKDLKNNFIIKKKDRFNKLHKPKYWIVT